MSEFIHSDLGYRESGDVLVVTLQGSAANVRLLDSLNFSLFQQGQQHRYHGGLAQQSPVRIPIPHSGLWHAVVDMQGLGGEVRAGFRVIPAAALRPLPPIQQTARIPGPAYTIQDVVENAIGSTPANGLAEYDVFVCHATEDKDAIARPLANALDVRGITVWYDEFDLKIGDSLRRKIDAGIAASRFGLVILSHAFFVKGWTQYELDGLVTRATDGKQVLLPVWHEVSKNEVAEHSPSLADKVALKTSDLTVDEIADQIADVIEGRHGHNT